MNIFHKIFKTIFPIQANEWRKFILMALIMFGILYISGSLRSIKDSIIVPSIGSIYLSFIDLYFVLPCSVIFTIIYTKLTNIMSRNHIYYIVLIIYAAFFILFGFFIYPDFYAIAHLNPPSPSTSYEYICVLINKWPITVFSIAVELWSPIILVLSFWQFTNANVSTSEAKRFYPSFGLISNFALIIAGIFINKISNLVNHENFIKFNMVIMSSIIVLLIFAIRATQQYINRITINRSAEAESTKLKLTLGKSIKLIVNSTYLIQIFIMIVSYGIINNIMEVRLKEVARELFPTQNEYAGFMGIFTSLGGIITILMMIVGGHMLRNHGWKKTALAPALVGLFTAIIFFSTYLIKSNFTISHSNLILDITVIVGTISLVLIKASKYSLFDNTKEMSYIPLDPELKIKGKAAIDLIGTRISDSGGAIIQSSLILLLGATSSNLFIMIIALCCITICVVWMKAVKKLNILYHEQIRKNEINY